MKAGQMMRRRSFSNDVTIFLAYMHRYVFIFLAILLPGMKDGLTGIGAGLLLYAVYSLAGYLLRWKHICCSYQNACHQKMTPNHVDWSRIKKRDAYGIPAIFGLLGIALMLISKYGQ